MNELILSPNDDENDRFWKSVRVAGAAAFERAVSQFEREHRAEFQMLQTVRQRWALIETFKRFFIAGLQCGAAQREDAESV